MSPVSARADIPVTWKGGFSEGGRVSSKISGERPTVQLVALL